MLFRSKRSVAGAIAKHQGSRFENIIKSIAARDQVACIQIESGMRVRRAPSGVLVPQPVRSQFDFVLACKGQCAFIDAKVTKNSTFSHSMMVPHQLYWLDLMRQQDMIAGYVIAFERETDAKVSFMSVELLKSVQKRQSLRPEDGIVLGNMYEFSLLKLFL